MQGFALYYVQYTKLQCSTTWWNRLTCEHCTGAIWGGLVCQLMQRHLTYGQDQLIQYFQHHQYVIYNQDEFCPQKNIMISVKYLMILLKIFVANFQTSPKLRIPQGWACSGGIGPNLFEEEIGKCENHKFPIKLPPPSVEFVTFNICLCSAVGFNLDPFSPFTCKQGSSLQSNIF